MIREKPVLLAWMLCAVLFAAGAHALSLDSVSVSPANATTTATISCLVEANGTGTLTADITWFRNGVPHGTDDQTISLTSGVQGSTTVVGNLEGSDTTKGDSWICQATLSNTTATTVSNSSAALIVNSPPVITFPSTTQVVNEDNTYNQTATASDADGDAIVTFISSDLNASLYSGTSLFTISSDGQIDFSPQQNKVGNHTMAILAYDGEGFGGSNVLFTVVEVDDPPIFSLLPIDKNATVGIPFSVILTGVDEEADDFNFTMASNNSHIIITPISSTVTNISFINSAPNASDVGVIEVNATAYQLDNNSVNTTVTFYINVTLPNSYPVLSFIPNQTAVQGQQFNLTVNATDNDTGDNLLFNLTTNCTLATNPWILNMVNNSSTAGSAEMNLTLTNDHVACPYVTFYVYDRFNSQLRGASDFQVVYMNITNVNDPPELFNISYSSNNSQLQTDMRSLVAGTDSLFTYTVNGSDPDQLTYEGDELTFTDNTSLFDMDGVTGEISFTPVALDIGEHLIRITLTDLAGLAVNETLNLTVLSNAPPLLASPGIIYCQEDVACSYNVSATDGDADENITFNASTNLVSFLKLTYNISQATATYTNAQVGNYTVHLTATDRFGLTNETNYTLIVNNTNDAPFFDNNQDGSSDLLAVPYPVVVGIQTHWAINVTDPDFSVTEENLTFSSDIINGTNTSLFTIVQNDSSTAYVQFTPMAEETGNYTVNISVVDSEGLEASQLVNFTVMNASNPPVITEIQPFTFAGLQTNVSRTAIANFTNETDVSFSEGDIVYFDLRFTDNDTADANITISWYGDGDNILDTFPGTVTNYTYPLTYFSAGEYNITAVVRDNLLSQDTFTWRFTVANVNRAPILVSNFPSRVINQTTSLGNEMTHFIDPDDDLDSDNFLDSDESNTLTFTMSASSVLDADFNDVDVTLTPQASGIEVVTYTAQDTDGLTATSNNVTYTVLYNPPQTTSSSSSGGGGGGGGASASSVITRRVDNPVPYAIDIITPKPITIYENETVIAPLAITNTGTVLLSDITLSAKSNQNVTLSFLDDSITELPVNQTYNTSLVIKGYRFAGTYEVFVTAKVASPAFNDSAVIFINSMEKSSEGEASVNTKITYARDLLTENPACGELVQIINQAENAYKNGNSEQAEELLAAVSEGCTYLKAQAAKEVEEPGILAQLAGYRYTNIILAALLVGLLVIGGALVAHYAKQQ